VELFEFALEFLKRPDVVLGGWVSTYQLWTYLILFVIIFAETGLVVTPFLPGDSLLFAAGAIATLGDNPLDPFTLFVVIAVAAILGDTVNYWAGRYLGLKVFGRFIKPAHLERTHQFYEKHGGKTIILARFVPIVRTLAPFVAGVGEMSYGKFITYNVVGGIVWPLIGVFAGYFFGQMPWVKANFSAVLIAIVIISVLPIVFEIARAKLAKRSAA
jgi:membrane-associated protein